MSNRSTVYNSGLVHVWTEPNYEYYDQKVTLIYISNQASEAIQDESDEASFVLNSPEGQAVYKAFVALEATLK